MASISVLLGMLALAGYGLFFYGGATSVSLYWGSLAMGAVTLMLALVSGRRSPGMARLGRSLGLCALLVGGAFYLWLKFAPMVL